MPIWNHPFANRRGTSSVFNDYDPDTWTATGWHHATDFPAPAGTAVLAAASGTVVQAGPNAEPSLGNTITINHGDGYATLYAHLTDATGSGVVTAGAQIGTVGSTGGFYTPHLHVEVHNPDRAHRVNSDFLATAPLINELPTPKGVPMFNLIKLGDNNKTYAVGITGRLQEVPTPDIGRMTLFRNLMLTSGNAGTMYFGDLNGAAGSTNSVAWYLNKINGPTA